jgi:hypothetical protein
MYNREAEIVGNRLSGQRRAGPLGEAKIEVSREYTTSEVEEEMYRYSRHLEHNDG